MVLPRVTNSSSQKITVLLLLILTLVPPLRQKKRKEKRGKVEREREKKTMCLGFSNCFFFVGGEGGYKIIVAFCTPLRHGHDGTHTTTLLYPPPLPLPFYIVSRESLWRNTHRRRCEKEEDVDVLRGLWSRRSLNLLFFLPLLFDRKERRRRRRRRRRKISGSANEFVGADRTLCALNT